MTNTQANNPLHGLTLQTIVETLETQLGWQKMGQAVKIKCFTDNPSVKSSLKFLRKTPWAREKVEQLYLSTMQQNKPKTSRKAKSKIAPEEFVWPDLPNKQ